jgi:hypothetical protein
MVIVSHRREGLAPRPPKFKDVWLEEVRCRDVVHDACGNDGSADGVCMVDAVKGFVASLQDWSSNVLGDLQKRFKKAKGELERYRRRSLSPKTVDREAILRFKVDRLEEQIDIFWKQRAHVNWLVKGDRNPSFFHQCCKERRKINRIGRLKKNDGGWVESKVEKQGFITNYSLHQLIRVVLGHSQCKNYAIVSILLETISRNYDPC